MDRIIIEAVLNGWKVKVGCQEVVFTSADKLCSELHAYLSDPGNVRKRYQEESVNAKWMKQQVPEPCATEACEAPSVLRRDDGQRIANVERR